MENSTSKLVGKMIQLIGLCICVWGAMEKNPVGSIGALVGLFGRFIDEYRDQWFG